MRINQLDILRAIAVLLVLGSHMESPPSNANLLTTWVADMWRDYGGLGVDLFFVLSGYLVSGLLFREQKAHGRMRVGRFLVRRGFKIYPAFYVFLVITVLLRIERGSVFSFWELFCEAAFVQNYGPSIWSHTWSLAVEEHFYLLLALLFLALRRWAPRAPFRLLPLYFCATAILVAVLRYLTFVNFPFTTKTHMFPTHLRIDELFFGVFLSYLHHFQPERLAVFRKATWSIMAAGTGAIVGWSYIPNDCVRYVLGPTIVSLAFGSMMLAALNISLPREGLAGRACSSVAFLGSHSYSVYLWHTAVFVFGMILVQKLLGDQLNYYLLFIAYLAGSFGFGVIMAKAVEIPFLRIRDRLFPSAATPKAPSMPVQCNTNELGLLPSPGLERT
jgi:peptidoglycan/LPS O-acetylase OafA/YrhL